MAKKMNEDEVAVTVLTSHNGPKGAVKEGDQYVTDQFHAIVLEEAGFVTIQNKEIDESKL